MIDTHVHIWDFSRARYSWLDNDTSILKRNYLIEELEPERLAAGVTGGVLMQAANTTQETDYMLEVAAATHWIKGVVGWVPLPDPGQVQQLLEEKYGKQPYFKGVRHLMHDEPTADWLLQENIIGSLHLLAQRNIPYDIVAIVPAHMRTTLEVINKVPELKLALDHLSQPPIATKQKFGEWGELMKEASKHTNVFVKISGLGTASRKQSDWTAEDVKPYIEFVLQHYGVDRCFCGGDWPVSLLAGSYARTWGIYENVLSELLSIDELKKVLYTNASAFYNLTKSAKE
jgi:L-fuconolactonase